MTNNKPKAPDDVRGLMNAQRREYYKRLQKSAKQRTKRTFLSGRLHYERIGRVSVLTLGKWRIYERCGSCLRLFGFLVLD